MAGAHASTVHRFSGDAPGSTATFRMDGPWSFAWTVTSEFPQLAFMEMHLYDADTDQFLGRLAQRDGAGDGEKIIPQAGSYRVVVIGRNIDWAVVVEPVTGDLAALVESRPDIERVQLVAPGTGLAPETIRDFTGWRAEGETALLLTTSGKATTRVPFHGGTTCPGLAESHNVFFVTVGFDVSLFNAIMLENGTRCYLDNPEPMTEAARE